MKINWNEVIPKILIGIMFAIQIGFVFYASQFMSEEEKTNLILLFQQWE